MATAVIQLESGGPGSGRHPYGKGGHFHPQSLYSRHYNGHWVEKQVHENGNKEYHLYNHQGELLKSAIGSKGKEELKKDVDTRMGVKAPDSVVKSGRRRIKIEEIGYTNPKRERIIAEAKSWGRFRIGDYINKHGGYSNFADKAVRDANRAKGYASGVSDHVGANLKAAYSGTGKLIASISYSFHEHVQDLHINYAVSKPKRILDGKDKGIMPQLMLSVMGEAAKKDYSVTLVDAAGHAKLYRKLGAVDNGGGSYASLKFPPEAVKALVEKHKGAMSASTDIFDEDFYPLLISAGGPGSGVYDHKKRRLELKQFIKDTRRSAKRTEKDSRRQQRRDAKAKIKDLRDAMKKQLKQAGYEQTKNKFAKAYGTPKRPKIKIDKKTNSEYDMRYRPTEGMIVHTVQLRRSGEWTSTYSKFQKNRWADIYQKKGADVDSLHYHLITPTVKQEQVHDAIDHHITKTGSIKNFKASKKRNASEVVLSSMKIVKAGGAGSGRKKEYAFKTVTRNHGWGYAGKGSKEGTHNYANKAFPNQLISVNHANGSWVHHDSTLFDGDKTLAKGTSAEDLGTHLGGIALPKKIAASSGLSAQRISKAIKTLNAAAVVYEDKVEGIQVKNFVKRCPSHPEVEAYRERISGSGKKLARKFLANIKAQVTKPSELLSSQGGINRKCTEFFLYRPKEILCAQRTLRYGHSGNGGQEYPVVGITSNGEKHVIDGNHRLNAALLLGIKAKAKVIDLTEFFELHGGGPGSGRHPYGHKLPLIPAKKLDRITHSASKVNKYLQKAGIEERILRQKGSYTWHKGNAAEWPMHERYATPKYNTIREHIEQAIEKHNAHTPEAKEAAKQQQKEEYKQNLPKGDTKFVGLTPEHTAVAKSVVNQLPEEFRKGLTIKYGDNEGGGRHAYGTVYMGKKDYKGALVDKATFKDVLAHEIGHHIDHGWINDHPEIGKEYRQVMDSYGAVNTRRVDAYEDHFSGREVGMNNQLGERRLRQERFAEAVRLKMFDKVGGESYRKNVSTPVRQFVDKIWKMASKGSLTASASKHSIQCALDVEAGGPGSGRHKELFTKPKNARPQVLSERQKIALKHYRPVTALDHQMGDKGERLVRQAIGGKATPDHHPVDIIKGKHGIEVKTLHKYPQRWEEKRSSRSSRNERIWMSKSKIGRKERWAKGAGAKLHTVVVDMRHPSGGGKIVKGDTPTAVYHRVGLGSHSIGVMTKTNLAGLRKLIK